MSTKLKTKALVTGATGFIGTRLCQLLKQQRIEVTAVGRKKAEGTWDHFVECDLADSLENLDLTGIDVVFHLAGKAHALSEFREEKDAYYKINVEGTSRLMEKAVRANTSRFIHFSSVKAMGEGNADYENSEPINENFRLVPAGPYGQSKLEAEKRVLEACPTIGATIIRPTMVFGPGAKGNLEKMIQAIRRHRFPPLPEFNNQRSMVHVDDLCEIAYLASINDCAIGKTYIAADEHSYSTREIYELICSALEKKPNKYQIPITLLKSLGYAGDIIGKVTNKRFVFDSDALSKLSSNALYDGSKVGTDLNFLYKHKLEKSLPEILAKQ